MLDLQFSNQHGVPPLRFKTWEYRFIAIKYFPDLDHEEIHLLHRREV
jgi:hypothetical protein